MLERVAVRVDELTIACVAYDARFAAMIHERIRVPAAKLWQRVYRGRFQSRMNLLLRSELSITSLIGRTRAGVNIVFALDDQTPSIETGPLLQPAHCSSLWRTIASCAMQETRT